MRLIDADQLEDVVTKANEQGFDITRYEFKRIKLVLFEFPTVDVEPVRHGHWIKNERYSDEIERHTVYECSECGELYYWYDTPEYKYCRHCGAKMDEVEE